MMVTRLGEALLLGLSTGPMCLAYCSPVLAPLLFAERSERWQATARLLGGFLAGRLAGYLVVGGLVGLVGAVVADALHGWPTVVITLATGVALLVFGAGKLAPRLDLCRLWQGDRSSPVWAPALGLLSGVAICPPFVAAIAGALTLESTPGAVAYFGAFFVGTAVFFLPVVALAPLTRLQELRTIGRLCLLLGGVWFVGRGLLMIAIG